MVALTGRLVDVTTAPVETITQVRVKAPAPRTGGDVVTTQPQKVPVGKDGSISLNVSEGLGWIYIDGDGWSDSIRFIAAAGMKYLWEAVANAHGVPGFTDYLQIISGIRGRLDDEARRAVEKNAEQIKWNRGLLVSAPDDADVLREDYEGVWGASARDATAKNLPEPDNGWLEVKVNTQVGSTSYVMQQWTTAAGGMWTRWLNAAADTWTEWVKGNHENWGLLANAGVDSADDMRMDHIGTWGGSKRDATTLGLPEPDNGVLTITPTTILGSASYVMQQWTTAAGGMWTRWFNAASAASTWTEWENCCGHAGDTPVRTATVRATEAIADAVLTVADPTTTYEKDHAALVADLKRRIGPVHLGNAGGLALVFDHGTTAFGDWVWPELKKRNLPATLALAPEAHLDGNGDARHQATNAQVAQWVKEGVAIASHSGDHLSATSYNDIWRQIVVSRQLLEEKLDTTVDAWVQPGYDKSLGDYKGFRSGDAAQRYTDTVAGRLLQQTYPVITGYVGTERLYPPEEMPVGMMRKIFEKTDTIQPSRDLVQQTADKGMKSINFTHPYAIGLSGYASKQDYLDFLDLIVQLRDAGKLKVLTLPQLAIATK